MSKNQRFIVFTSFEKTLPSPHCYQKNQERYIEILSVYIQGDPNYRDKNSETDRTSENNSGFSHKLMSWEKRFAFKIRGVKVLRKKIFWRYISYSYM